jgi:hypothetical protein
MQTTVGGGAEPAVVATNATGEVDREERMKVPYSLLRRFSRILSLNFVGPRDPLFSSLVEFIRTMTNLTLSQVLNFTSIPLVSANTVYEFNVHFFPIQLDEEKLESTFRLERDTLKSFLSDDNQQNVLIRRDPTSKSVSVWLTAPFDADTKNSITFIKKEGVRLDPKDLGRSLLYQAGAPPEMQRLSEESTLETLEKLQARADEAAAAAAASAARPAWGLSNASSSSSTPVQTPKKEGPEFEGTWAGASSA